MVVAPVHTSTDLNQRIFARITKLWAEAEVEPEYLGSMRSVLLSARVWGTAPPSARNAVPFLSLSGLCCEAAGGTRQQAEMVASAWTLLYEAAHLLDSIEDGEVGVGQSSTLGSGPLLNIATGLITSAGLALCALEDSESARAIRQDFHRTTLKICAGQHVDLTQPEPSLEQCWQIAEAKSGAFFALACRVGAQLACDEADRLVLFSEFGQHLGVLVQIGDDIGGLRAIAGEHSDLATGGKWTLPVAYAMAVLSGVERDQLRRWLQVASVDANAEAEARCLIAESGGMLYLTVEAERRRQLAGSALLKAASPSAARNELQAMLSIIATPSKM